MVWYDDLFVGESISSGRKKRVMRKVKRRSIFNAAYLLTLSANQQDLIDIIHTRVVRQRYYPRKNLVVIGLAGSYEEALTLAAEILVCLYTVQGDFKLREFLKKNWHNSREDGLLC